MGASHAASAAAHTFAMVTKWDTIIFTTFMSGFFVQCVTEIELPFAALMLSLIT
jgi:hypothetical protein